MQMTRIKTFSIEEVEAMRKQDVNSSECQKFDKNAEHNIKVEGYDVYTTSLRYKTFMEKGYKCVCCGRIGTHYILEHPNGSNEKRAHFNLYSDDDVLMTKDHILPKSMGGADRIENMQTMCSICNSAKGNQIPNGYVPLDCQKKKKSNREYFWRGKKRYASLEKAAMAVTGGNKDKVPKAKRKIRESVKNGTPYFGVVWRYGKEV